MRGLGTGSLERTYLHSAITEGLFRAVEECEGLFLAKLLHANMLASMYGNPDTDIGEANGQIHDMYIKALSSKPYISKFTKRRSSDTDDLIETWKRMNAERAEKKEKGET